MHWEGNIKTYRTYKYCYIHFEKANKCRNKEHNVILIVHAYQAPGEMELVTQSRQILLGGLVMKSNLALDVASSEDIIIEEIHFS